MLGVVILVVSGFIVGDVLVRNIRRFVVDARSGNQHANGMLMTYVFAGIVGVNILLFVISNWLKCSSLWFFPTFLISFLINMLRQYKDENGSLEPPKVNQEFINQWQKDLEKKVKKNK